MAAPTTLYWDSNVFIAYLSNETEKYDVDSIARFLADARTGKCRIWASSLTITEILPSRIKLKSTPTFSEFVDDMGSAVQLFDPNPNVMRLAAELRDLPYKKGQSSNRTLATPDAIHLATCLHLREEWTVPIQTFHTFDDGKGRTPDGGRSIPLLSYHEWCEGIENHPLASRVIGLKRERPTHPSPRLPLGMT